MFKFIRRIASILEDLKYSVQDLKTGTYELKTLSLPRQLNHISTKMRTIGNSIDRIYYLLEKYIESKEISDINKLRIENQTLRDCIKMEKETNRKRKNKEEYKGSAQYCYKDNVREG